MIVRLQPRWSIGVAIYLAYASWVVAAWAVFDVDYASLGTLPNLLKAVILPLGIAAVALFVFSWLSGWWPRTIGDPRLHRPVFLAVLLVLMAGFIGLNMHATDWATLGLKHTLVLAAAMLLVGFCEEIVTRGVLLVALRGSLRSEAWVWFCSSALFGLLHATNAMFGLGAAALVQVVLAFCAGTGLYLLRRLSGSLWLAIAAHTLWDFSSMAHGLAPDIAPAGAVILLAGIYGTSLVFTFFVLRRESVRA